MFRLFSFRSVVRRQGTDDLHCLDTNGDDLSDEPQDVILIVAPVRIAFDAGARIARDAILVDNPVQRRTVAEPVIEDLGRNSG